MNKKIFQEYSKWLSQLTGAISLTIIVFIRSKFVFESGNSAVRLVWVAIIASLFTLIFGIASLPRWQGFVALSIFVLVVYFILFEPLYALA